MCEAVRSGGARSLVPVLSTPNTSFLVRKAVSFSQISSPSWIFELKAGREDTEVGICCSRQGKRATWEDRPTLSISNGGTSMPRIGSVGQGMAEEPNEEERGSRG